jgi:hypothetical protein
MKLYSEGLENFYAYRQLDGHSKFNKHSGAQDNEHGRTEIMQSHTQLAVHSIKSKFILKHSIHIGNIGKLCPHVNEILIRVR